MALEIASYGLLQRLERSRRASCASSLHDKCVEVAMNMDLRGSFCQSEPDLVTYKSLNVLRHAAMEELGVADGKETALGRR